MLFVVSAVLAAIILVLGIEIYLSQSSFRASSRLIVVPFTNGVLEPAFQAKAFQSIPNVRIEYQIGRSWIEVVAHASTAEAALTNATEATHRLLGTALESFGTGVSLHVVQEATIANQR